jgi:small subunit ribosomal protein S13
LARIAGVDLPKNKRIEIGLTYIYGIGRSSSRKILEKLAIDIDTKTDQLTEIKSVASVK